MIVNFTIEHARTHVRMYESSNIECAYGRGLTALSVYPLKCYNAYPGTQKINLVPTVGTLSLSFQVPRYLFILSMFVVLSNKWDYEQALGMKFIGMQGT